MLYTDLTSTRFRNCFLEQPIPFLGNDEDKSNFSKLLNSARKKEKSTGRNQGQAPT